MLRQILAKGPQLLPHGVLEQVGVLMWAASVLLIGLHLAVRIPDQPVFRTMLERSATMLTSLAVLSGLAVACITAVRALRIRWRPARTRTRPSNMQRDGRYARPAASMLLLRQLLVLTVDLLLAATLVRTALAWVDQASLSAWRVACLVGLGALHVTFLVWHEHTARS